MFICIKRRIKWSWIFQTSDSSTLQLLFLTQVKVWSKVCGQIENSWFISMGSGSLLGQILGCYRISDFTAVKLIYIRQESDPPHFSAVMLPCTGWKISFAVLSVRYFNEYNIIRQISSFDQVNSRLGHLVRLIDGCWEVGKNALVSSGEGKREKTFQRLSYFMWTVNVFYFESNGEAPVFLLKIWEACLPTYWP